MEVRTTKAEAAVRQLDVAIGLLFSDGDPLAIRTLAAAAHTVLADLVDARQSGTSWRENVITGSGLPRQAVVRLLNAASNFLKHADRDPDPGAELCFPEEENDHLIFIASLECGELGHPTSPSMQAFQIWVLARYPDHLGREMEHVQTALAGLPNLFNDAREDALRRGAEMLQRVLGWRGLY